MKGAGFAERPSERLYRRHLTSYFAAAVMMPYARFLRACGERAMIWNCCKGDSARGSSRSRTG